MQPKVSVVVPAYNSSLFIGNAINSILEQNYTAEIQIIVVDDGSSDDTANVVLEMSHDHPQIICVPNFRKKGPSGARNTGLLYAFGEYIAFLDADDLWLPNHLEEGVNFLEKNNSADIVFFNFGIIDYVAKRRIGDWFSERSFTRKLNVMKLDEQYKLICDDIFNVLLDESFIHLQSMIIRKKALLGILFNEDIKRSEDRDFAIRLFYDSKARFAFKDIETGVYYRHEQSLTKESIDNDLSTGLDHIKLFSGYLLAYKLDPLKIYKLKKILYERYMSVSYCYRRLNIHKLSIISLWKSFRYRVSVSQVVEFVKIVISYIRINFFQRKE